MVYLVLVNAKSGTVRDKGASALKSELEQAFSDHDAEAEIHLFDPRDTNDEIEAARKRARPGDVIVVGGGDGTLSCAAGLLAGSKTTMAVLPLGTMNLFARAIEMPLDPVEAVGAIVTASRKEIDLLEINGRTGLMHASIGLQPKIIRIREALPYRTRFSRLLNGLIAWARVTRRPKRLRIRGEMNHQSFDALASAVLVSNNVMPEGLAETPVSHNLSGGKIGIYVMTTRKRSEIVRLLLETSLGAWRNSDLVEEFTTRSVEIDTGKDNLLVSLDGELVRFSTPLRIRIVPRALRVLMPGFAA